MDYEGRGRTGREAGDGLNEGGREARMIGLRHMRKLPKFYMAAKSSDEEDGKKKA